MHRTTTGLFFSPSDLNHFVECAHLTALDLQGVKGHPVPKREDPQADLIRQKGLEHERAWLAGLHRDGRTVVQVAGEGPIDWARESARTVDAMRAGADVIYQGVFEHAPWRGIADFLVRVDTPSELGAWSYEAWDTKLARHPRPYFILQLSWYSEQLGRLQGLAPRRMHVVLGTGESVAFALDDFADYYHAVRDRFLRAAETGLVDSYPMPVSHCHVCGYADHCRDRRREDDHLSLVAGMRGHQVERLSEVGETTVAQLAETARLGAELSLPPVYLRLARQAKLQHEARVTPHRWEMLPPEERRGLGLLPPPSPGDVFFDIEGYPYFEPSRGLEYLWGVVLQDAGAWRFRSFEGADRTGERRAFEQFVDFVCARLADDPDMHVYHYAAYETSAIKRLMSEFGTREAEVDALLRRRVFVDLYQVLRQSLQVSYDSYSLKKVRQFFMTDAGGGVVSDGGESILEFQRFLETGDQAILAAIRDYNAEDCESTRLLRDWLLERKAEAETQFGRPIPWAEPPADVDDRVEERADTLALRERLNRVSGTAADDALRRASLTLANLLDYHRREAKPAWWAFYDRLGKSLDELRDDAEAIAHLTPTNEPPETERRSLIHTLQFPMQEFKLREGSEVTDPATGRSAGQIVSVDLAGTLRLRRGPTLSSVPLPSAIVASGPLSARAHQESLARVGSRLADGAAADGVSRALLVRDLPRVRGVNPGTSLQTMDLAAQQALIAALDASYLVIQGPPGSGKTYTGARLIVDLIRRGARVAVSATSHKAVHNLLDEVVRAGREMGVPVSGIKKSSGSDDSRFDAPGFESVESNQVCELSQAPIVAGTSWLFAREGMAGQFDYLFIDEAGQVSLADAVAMSPCAGNVVLLGDPQQLPHVTQGVHPGGVGVSVLEHLLDGAATVPPDRGLFLDQTWRLHPDVCGFISDLAYEGRLHAHPDCARQRVEAQGLSGTGLRWLPVPHVGNAQQSLEEAALIAEHVRQLLASGTFIDRHGSVRLLTPADILVVAPYNMQVHALIEALPIGVEAGTVDKFQGREAPVVFFSLATSTGEDIPRGLEFLFSRNRLNVAISRAKALAVLVGSPRLLETRCRTVDQMRLVNALCRFVARSA